MAVEEINQNGGVLGRPIDLILIDNKSTAIDSAEAAKQAIVKNVVAIIGSSWSAHSLAMAPLAQEAGIPMISNLSTHPKVTEIGSYIFRVCFLDAVQAETMARFAFLNLKVRKVAILYENGNDYSTDLASHFSKVFRKMGGQVPVHLAYLKDSLDYTIQLDPIQAAQVEAVFLPGYEKEVGLIMKQAFLKGMKIPFLGADGWGNLVSQYYGGPIPLAYEVKPWNYESPDPKSRKFVANQRQKYPQDTEVLAGTALAYDATMLLADAIRRAGSLDRSQIRQALAETTDFVGVTGPIRFNAKRNPLRGAVINRYQNSRTGQYYLTVQP